MPRLSVYRNKSIVSGGEGQTRGLAINSSWDEVSENTIEVPSYNDNTQETSIKVELLVLVDDDCDLTQEPEDFSDLNNSFYFVCNEDWITVLRNRNLITLIIRNNHSTEERNGIVSFYHNVGKYDYRTVIENGEETVVAVENEINLNIIQNGCEYSVEIEGNFEGEGKTLMLDSLPDGFEEKFFTVNCIGGRERFKVRKVKKYKRLLIKENEYDDPIEIISPVAYDNSFQIEYTDNGFKVINFGNINCNYTEKCPSSSSISYPLEMKTCYTGNKKKRDLITDDYYYEITIHHIDCIDSIDTLIVTYDSEDEEKIATTPKVRTMLYAVRPFMETIPSFVNVVAKNITDRLVEAYEEGDMELYNQILEELNSYIQESANSDVIKGSISCSSNELRFENEGGTKSVIVTTEPEDAAVFIKHCSDFVTKCVMVGNEIRVTLARNPYPFERTCVINLINAVYSKNTINLLIYQSGID